MPVFEMQTPDGRTFEVEAPDMNAAVKALEGFTTQSKAPDAPWYADAAQAADDMARIGANALTFGFADKLAGYLGGRGTEAERAATGEARDRAGWAAPAMDVLGGAATGVGLAGKGLTAMRAVPATLGGVKGVAARTGAMAADGAAMGAMNALGYDQNVGTGALVGAAAGGVGNLLGEGVGALFRGGKSGAAVPSLDDIKARGSDAYEAAAKHDVIIGKPAMQRLRADMVDVLAEEGYMPEIQGKVSSILKSVDRLSETNVGLKGLENIRKVALNVAQSQDASERRLAGMLIDKIDDFAAGLGKADVLQGDVGAATSLLKEARASWRQFRKAELVDDTLKSAELQTASAYSGGNIDNATRQKIKGILGNKKLSRQFTATEREIMRQIVKGAPGQNIVRLLGKLSPTGSGLMAILQAGGAAALGPVALTAPVVGMAAKGVSDRMTSSAVQRLVEAVRLGQIPPQALNNLPGPVRDAAVRLLTSGGITAAMPLIPAQQ